MPLVPRLLSCCKRCIHDNTKCPTRWFYRSRSAHEATRQWVNRTVNIERIDLYWQIGEYVSLKIAIDTWGKSTVKALASYIQLHQPRLRGFSPQNIWCMWQFYEAYYPDQKFSTLLRELPWSSQSKCFDAFKTTGRARILSTHGDAKSLASAWSGQANR